MVSATTRCSSWPARPRRPPSSRRRRRTASAIAPSRRGGCWSCCMPTIALERPSQVQLTVLPPLTLYVHIPWCVRKCPYCDFNSHERDGPVPEREYVGKLIADLEALLPSVWGRRL